MRQWRTARQGQTLRVGRPLVGGLSLHCHKGFQEAVRRGHQKSANAGLGLLLRGRTTAHDPRALGGAQCGEQRGPDLKHSTLTTQLVSSELCLELVLVNLTQKQQAVTIGNKFQRAASRNSALRQPTPARGGDRAITAKMISIV